VCAIAEEKKNSEGISFIFSRVEREQWRRNGVCMFIHKRFKNVINDYDHSYQIFCIAVGLERGPLSFVGINEELLERKVAALVKKTEINDRGRSAMLTM
jgi:hypothetical protein